MPVLCRIQVLDRIENGKPYHVEYETQEIQTTLATIRYTLVDFFSQILSDLTIS